MDVARIHLINPKSRRERGERGGVLLGLRTSKPTEQRRIWIYEMGARDFFCILFWMRVL